MVRKASPVRYSITPKVMAEIEEHAYSTLTAEVGGMLMGTVDKGVTKIVGFIPALSASAEQVTLTFTHDVWEEILKLAAKQFPKHAIVGWYHTHPTFGVFLSEYDLFIQENFFGADGHLALVIDPVQGTYGWFAKTGKGKIGVFEEGLTQTGPKRAVDPPNIVDSSARSAGVRIGAAGVVGLLVGGALGAGLMLTQIPPDLSGALESTRAELIQRSSDFVLFQQLTSDLFQDPVLEYQVQEGDSVDRIAEIFYQNPEAGRVLILAANELDFFAELVPGTILRVPSPDNVGISVVRPSDVLPDPMPAFTGLPPYVRGGAPVIADDGSTEMPGDPEDSNPEVMVQ